MARRDDESRPIPQGRLSRFMKLGNLGGAVGASLARDRLLSLVRTSEARDEAMRRSLEKNAARIVRTMGEMKGAAMKLGQMLSAAPVDARVPAEIQEALAVLQREAPPMPWDTVVAQVEAAFDRPLETLFRQFSHAPVAAASIGQVHRAETFDGRDVAVKVQYPGVRESLDHDLRNLATLLSLGRGLVERQRLEGWAEEVREVILAESDYRDEADNLVRYGGRLADDPRVRVPRPVPELTRETVLTMDYLEGEKLDTWLADQPLGPRGERLLALVDLFVGMIHDHQFLHADPHPGNFLVDAEGRFVLLDFGAVKALDPAFSDGLLRLLVACWEGAPERLPALFEALGFGREGRPVEVTPEVLAGFLDRALAPFLAEGSFDFGSWDPNPELERYFLSHPSMLTLAPPREGIFYFRVTSGLWGLLQRAGVRVALKAHAQGVARRRGLLA